MISSAIRFCGYCLMFNKADTQSCLLINLIAHYFCMQTPSKKASQPSQPHPHQSVNLPSPQENSPTLAPPQLPLEGNSQQVATFVDGQYFLTDPQSRAKLQHIEAEIKLQTSKLNDMSQNQLPRNGSFLSQYGNNAETLSNHQSFCDTQFDHGKHHLRKEKVKNQLEEEEEQYRLKIRQMMMRKAEIKQRMRLVDNAEEIEVVKRQIEEEVPNIKEPSRKSAPKSIHTQKQKEVATPDGATPEVEQSIKSAQKSVREQEKSYHKSKIQKSIRENSLIHQEPAKQPTVKKEASLHESAKPASIMKGSSLKEAASVKDNPSIKDNHNSKEASIKQASVKEVSVKEASAKESVKSHLKIEKEQSQIDKKTEKSQKVSHEVLEPAISERKSAIKSEKPSALLEHTPNDRPTSVKLSQKPETVKHSQKQQSVKPSEKAEVSVRQPSKQLAIDNKSEKKSHRSSRSKQIQPKIELYPEVDLPEIPHSQRKPSVHGSAASSLLSKQEGKAQASQRPSANYNVIVTGVESHRTHSHYPENDIKSKKSSIIDALIIAPEDAPFDKAEVASKKSAAPSQKQSSQRGVLMEEEVKSKRSEAQSGNERARSKKSSRLIQQIEEAKSKKSEVGQLVGKAPSEKYEQLPNDPQDTKSHHSHLLVNEEVRSKRSHHHEDAKSKKSNILQEEAIEDIKSKKSQALYEEAELKSRKSHKVEERQPSRKSHNVRESSVKSKQSSLVSQPEVKPQAHVEEAAPQSVHEVASRHSEVEESSRSKQSGKIVSVRTKKAEEQQQKRQEVVKEESVKQPTAQHRKIDTVSNSQSVASAKPSSVKASEKSAHKKEEEKPKKLVDRSIQYSRVTESQPAETIEPYKSSHFSPPKSSVKSNSFLQENDESVEEESSQTNQPTLQPQELMPERKQQPEPVYDMRKKKESDRQSEKKSKSFVIHSRQGSVKERSEKDRSEKSSVLDGSKMSEKKGLREELERSRNSEAESVTKEQLAKLQECIALLEQKLKKVEERQEQMEKVESVIISKKEDKPQEIIKHAPIEVSELVPEPSQQHQKKEEAQREEPVQREEQDAMEPMIPEMPKTQPRMLKLSSSIVEVSNAEEFRRKLAEATERSEREQLQDEIRRLKRIIRDMQIDKIKSIDQEAELSKSSLHSQDHSRLQQEHSRLQPEYEDTGSMEEKPIQKRLGGSLLRSRLAEDAGKIMRNSPERAETRKGSNRGEYGEEEVVVDSVQNGSPRRMSTFRKGEENKQQMKDRTIHHFMESSRAIAEEIGRQDIPEPTPNFPDRSRHAETSKHSTINYSRMVEEMKKNNPEEEPPLPEIHLREVNIPALPSPPSPEMAQEALLQLAKQTYRLFGVEVDREGLQLCVKKYKNCVSFSIASIPSECILWHYSGKFYMGGWRGDGGEGEKNGEGLEVVPGKHVYRGQFLLGKRHGTGIMRLANGNLYDGQWVEGAKNGHGVFLDAATQVVYSGQWKDGRKDGVGFLKLSDKEHYNGTFSQSVKHGHGSETFLNGDRYKGEYHLGKFHGKGKYTWANGSCYEGDFVEGCRHGHGSWKSAGSGGDIYIGTYESDRKNGYGRYVWANGCVYEGSFANDVKHGKGRLVYQDGKEVKGVWQEGALLAAEGQKSQGMVGEHEDQPLRKSMKQSELRAAARRP